MRKIHLLTADVPFGLLPKDVAKSSLLRPSDNTTLDLPIGTVLVGQTPNWLSTNASDPPLDLVHHSSIFKVLGAENDENFLAASLPTFNSLAIEARMARISDLREHVLYMNVRCGLVR